MKERPQEWVLHFNWGSSRGTIGLSKRAIANVARVEKGRTGWDVRDIDMVLAHRMDGISVEDGVVESMPIEERLSLLRTLPTRKPHVTLFCANSDLAMDGDELRTMPGRLAKEYENAGGKVIRLGKAGKIAYKAACAEGRVLAVGDSVGHDMFGAGGIGVDCLFVCSGIHREKFWEGGFRWDEAAFSTVLTEEEVTLNSTPKYICELFRWQQQIIGHCAKSPELNS